MYTSTLVLVTLLSQYLSASHFDVNLVYCASVFSCATCLHCKRIVKSLNLRSQTLSLNPKTKQMNKKSHL